jgi:hypothetical protein
VDIDAAGRLERRVRHAMVLAATTVQRRFRLNTGRQEASRWVSVVRQQQDSDALLPYVVQVQRQWRRIKACHVARSCAQHVYKKYVDAGTGEPYWFNRRIGTISMTIPYCLRHDNHDVFSRDVETLHVSKERTLLRKIVNITAPPEIDDSEEKRSSFLAPPHHHPHASQ